MKPEATTVADFIGSLSGTLYLVSNTDLDQPTFTSKDWEEHSTDSEAQPLSSRK
ncbi:MAG: hypothetical protein AAGC74_13410 [Verrucomicrobiota bacterium]